jgi:hypothetical protein
MADQNSFPAELKLDILSKVQKKAQFFYEEKKHKDDEDHADELLTSLNNL